MRMWMCDPTILCVRHLGGEYNELLKFAGSVRKKRRIDKYIENNCLEPLSLVDRFRVIWMEKISRGHSPQKNPDILLDLDFSYLPIDQQEYIVDRQSALDDLLNRCPRCYARFYDLPEPKIRRKTS